MKEICKKSVKAVKENWFFNKISKLNNYFSSFLKFNLAIAMLIFIIIAVNAGDVIVKNGELNITDNLFVDTNTLFVDSVNNKVGIGTAFPTNSLHISSTDVELVRFEGGSNGSYVGIILNHTAPAGTSWLIDSYKNGFEIWDFDGSTSRFVIQNNTGSVGIGTSTPQSYIGYVVLTVGDNSGSKIGLIKLRSSYNSGDGAEIYQTTAGLLNFALTGSVIGMSIESDGSVGIGTTAPTAGIELDVEGQAECDGAGCWTVESDLALKENITNSTYGLAEVLKITPRDYNYKDSGNKSFGLIAQELKLIIPEVVYGEEGNMSIGYGGLTPILIKAVQEQQSQIEILKARIDVLEGK